MARQEDADTLTFFDNATEETTEVLFLTEVVALMEKRRKDESMQEKPMSDVFHKTEDYCKAFQSLASVTHVEEVRATLANYHRSKYEEAQLVNLMPQTADEARAIIPSLNDMDDLELDQLVSQLSHYAA
eukprot:m.352563 g.352563  ORF g.352563 m.352563 type:complete len:129 (+) comp16553_c0_seq1:171-557(+)